MGPNTSFPVIWLLWLQLQSIFCSYEQLGPYLWSFLPEGKILREKKRKKKIKQRDCQWITKANPKKSNAPCAQRFTTMKWLSYTVDLQIDLCFICARIDPVVCISDLLYSESFVSMWVADLFSRICDYIVSQANFNKPLSFSTFILLTQFPLISLINCESSAIICS